MAPFAPHLSEYLWSELGHEASIFQERWPEYDEKLIQDEEVEMAIQINGKVRGKIVVSADISEEDAKKKALQDEKIKRILDEKGVKKVVFVKGRLVNFVVSVT
jgi:leucyl-tRNA synthetase